MYSRPVFSRRCIINFEQVPSPPLLVIHRCRRVNLSTATWRSSLVLSLSGATGARVGVPRLKVISRKRLYHWYWSTYYKLGLKPMGRAVDSMLQRRRPRTANNALYSKIPSHIIHRLYIVNVEPYCNRTEAAMFGCKPASTAAVSITTYYIPIYTIVIETPTIAEPLNNPHTAHRLAVLPARKP